VLDAMKNIYRRAFHEQFADEVKDVWLEHTRNLMLREYFPTVYHPQYFEGKSYAESIRKFLRFADQRFTHIQIRGTDTADDFVVTAIIPGSCMVLLARISDEHAVTPTLDEVELIVANRHANIDYKWPVGIGLAFSGKRATKADYWLPRLHDPSCDLYSKYCRCDCERTILLFLLFQEILSQETLLKGYEREKRLLPTIYRMETGGITVKNKPLEAKIESLKEECEVRRRRCNRFGAKHSRNPQFNCNSAAHLTGLLYNEFQLAPLKTTKTNAPSVDKDSLSHLYTKIKNEDEGYCTAGQRRELAKPLLKFLNDILELKVHQKGLESLVSYKQRALPINGFRRFYSRLYPSINQSGTITTRLSSNDPNGQNVSKKRLVRILDEEIEGPKVRDVYGPQSGRVWYAIDYSQLELRVFAAASNEQSLIQALADGYDFHGYVASKIFDKPIDQITDDERRIAKNVNFALIFGAGPAKVNATAKRADAYDLFSSLFPNVKSFMTETIERAVKDGYVHTMDGYRLTVPRNAPYKSVNYIVQGTAGSIIKRAMTLIDERKRINWKTSRLIIPIHDELVSEFRTDEPHVHHVHGMVKDMEEAGSELGILTPVSVERITSNWGNGQEVQVTKKRIIVPAA
jgi:DNA polymerase-1